jgi:hypothetical protein
MWWIMFIVAFIVMSIIEGIRMFPPPRCDEHCSKEALKLICTYYRFLGYVDSCTMIDC